MAKKSKRGIAQQKIEENFPSDLGRQDSKGVSSEMKVALAGFLPTIVGALFGGSEGAAVGANVGGRAIQGLSDMEANQQMAQARAQGDINALKGRALLQDAAAEQSMMKGDSKSRGDKGSKLSESEAKARSSSVQMEAAESFMDRVKKEGFDPTSAKTAFQHLVSDILPNSVSRAFTSEEFQKFKQASDFFLNANLRDESGATIGKEEQARRAAQLIELPFEEPSTVKQKKIAREIITLATKEKGRNLSEEQRENLVQSALQKAGQIVQAQTKTGQTGLMSTSNQPSNLNNPASLSGKFIVDKKTGKRFRIK